ncbi:MAG TPA: glycine zipper 2TM domain-containing protein [Burkholderiaceae bacterium]|nr:glycine zipper 2TM domain-containing protein [Burkholderiaceae bacterium]
MRRFTSALCAFSLVATLGACASMGGSSSSAPQEIRQGRIEQITNVQLDHPHQLGVGAILGGAGGAAIGSLVGAGTGRDVAIAIGAIAGAVGGQYAENKYENKQPGQQIVVRLMSGVLVVVTQPVNANLFVGEPVYIEGAGQDAHVLPRN